MPKPGYVYVATDGEFPGHCKVGKTINVEQRERTLNGSKMKATIKIVDSVWVDDMDTVEQAFHKILNHRRTEGEWFNIEKDDVVPMLECLDMPNHPPNSTSRGNMGKERSGRTPRSAFHEPIVEVLRELGGKGQAKDVVERVGQRMELRSADYERSAGGTIVWKQRIHSARSYLKSEGTLKSNAPRGWWELADRVLRAVEAETQAAEAARLRESRRAANAPKGTLGVSQADVTTEVELVQHDTNFGIWEAYVLVDSFTRAEVGRLVRVVDEDDRGVKLTIRRDGTGVLTFVGTYLVGGPRKIGLIVDEHDLSEAVLSEAVHGDVVISQQSRERESPIEVQHDRIIHLVSEMVEGHEVRFKVNRDVTDDDRDTAWVIRVPLSDFKPASDWMLGVVDSMYLFM